MNHAWTLPLSRWSIWAEGEAAAPSSVDAGLRRRLSPLAKMSLGVMHECLGATPRARIVYASRHGELDRTTGMLLDLARGLELSPTAFSMSVLNATAGVDSISRRDHSTASAISAGPCTLGWALLEASLQWASDPGTPLVLVYADAPVPVLYGRTTIDPMTPIAVGLLLDNDATKRMTCRIAESSIGPSSRSQVEALLQCLRGVQTEAWHDGTREWRWAIEAT